jgi:hypothetical protein
MPPALPGSASPLPEAGVPPLTSAPLASPPHTLLIPLARLLARVAAQRAAKDVTALAREADHGR